MCVALAATGADFGTQHVYRALHNDESPKGNVDNSVLAIAPDELDLGRLWETSAYEHVVHITNVSDRPVTISQFRKSCDCLGITPEEGVTLRPSETHAVTLKLSLVPRVWSPNSSEGEPFRATFAARYSVEGEPEGTAEWQVIAAILPTIRLSPPILRFRMKSDRQSIEESVHIEAAAGIDSVTGEAPAGWSVRITDDAAAGGSRGKFTAVLRRNTEAKAGQISEVFRFYPVAAQGKRLPAKDLQMVGDVVHDVVAHPQEIHHGRKPRGTTTEETIRLVSLTERRFRVTSATSRSADLQVSRVSDVGEQPHYSLRLRAAGVGEQEALAEFTIQDEAGNEFTVLVPVRYHGVEGR